MSSKNTNRQPFLPFRPRKQPVLIVKNHWNPCFHLQQRNGYSVDGALGSYCSVAEARRAAARLGLIAEGPFRNGGGGYTPMVDPETECPHRGTCPTWRTSRDALVLADLQAVDTGIRG